MSWAVLQTEVERPSATQFQNALRQVPGLTAADGLVLARAAFGVLAMGLEASQAAAMQTAFTAEGVPCEAVEEPRLRQLPPPRQLSKVEFTDEGLRVDNLLGRIVLLPWADVAVIAAGWVRLTEFQKEMEEKIISGASSDSMPRAILTAVTREKQNDHLLLEIIARDAAQRFHAAADQPETMLLFGCLGERRGRDPAANLIQFVGDLAARAPNAVLNHGAFFMREDGDASFRYQSKTAFYREITWLLWMIATGRVQRSSEGEMQNESPAC